MVELKIWIHMNNDSILENGLINQTRINKVFILIVRTLYEKKKKIVIAWFKHPKVHAAAPHLSPSRARIPHERRKMNSSGRNSGITAVKRRWLHSWAATAAHCSESRRVQQQQQQQLVCEIQRRDLRGNPSNSPLYIYIFFYMNLSCEWRRRRSGEKRLWKRIHTFVSKEMRWKLSHASQWYTRERGKKKKKKQKRRIEYCSRVILTSLKDLHYNIWLWCYANCSALFLFWDLCFCIIIYAVTAWRMCMLRFYYSIFICISLFNIKLFKLLYLLFRKIIE